MARRRRRSQARIDVLLMASVVALLLFGLLMLYSATFYVGTYFWRQQLLWIGAGLALMTFFVFVPYRLWQGLAAPMMGVTLFLLFVVLLMGERIFGAQRALFGASVQPGILARLVAVIYIAAWLASKGEKLNEVRYGLVPFSVIVGVVAGLIALQPDLSTALLLVLTGLAMFFFAGGDPVQIFLSVVIGGGSFGLLAWQLPHARQRLTDYIAALQDPTQMPYHVHRAVMALGEGGLFGVGIGNGRLKAGYLPFPHTDSIFAVIGEETGLVGTLLVIAFFAFFAYRGYRVALQTAEPFGSLLAFGVTTMIVVEALLNVMVMVSLIPFTGTALPFFSYGGSEMVMTLGGGGLLLGVSRGRAGDPLLGDFNGLLDRLRRYRRARLSRPGRTRSAATH